MTQLEPYIDDSDRKDFNERPSKRISFMRFFQRYPIFLLAFGPPIFRPSAGIDATKGVVDFWAFLQVGLLSVVAFRASWRLAAAQTILIPRQIRSILKLAFFLGLLFIASSLYSNSRTVSAAYSILYFLTWISVVEFIVDVYRNPPNWMQCIFQLRLISFLLFGVVLFTLLFAPQLVLYVLPGAGIRLLGGAVATVTVICPTISIISAYTYLNSLEPKPRAVFFFLTGLIGTLATQSRGSEFALLFSFMVLAYGWAKTGRRSSHMFVSGLMASILISGAIVGIIGGGRIWNTINRGQNAAGIASASGRTEIWKFVIQYCMTHPQGMGYIAGFRTIFREYFALGLQVEVTHIGTAHSAYIQVLADAGWLALAIYLVMIAKVIIYGLNHANIRNSVAFAPNNVSRHAVRCALVLLVFCLVNGIYSSEFVLPLRGIFYMQNLFIAIILGASARMVIASRSM